MSKKIIGLILLLVFFLSILTNRVMANTVQTGKFSYMPAFADKTEEIYFYSDDYFKQSGKIENEHLLTMSFNLAISTFEIRNASFSTKLLEDIGFQNVLVEDMLEAPTLDTIGTVIANKKIGDYNVIAVAIRGEKYDSEWGSNFIVGSEGNAKGFNDASNKVNERIKKYIDDNNLKNNKIWISGYSRAGTIADLTGVYINNNLDMFNVVSDDNLYIYTFEAPAASLDKTIYDDIYSIININDIIPFVYPDGWEFYRNGKVINIGEDKNITTYIGLTEQKEYEDIISKEFYNQFFNWLTSRLDRRTYSENLEEPISKLFDIYFSKSEADREKLKNFFLEDVKNEVLNNPENFGKIKGKVWSVLGHNSDYLYQCITDDITQILDGLRNTPNGLVLTDEEYNTLINSIYPILRVIGPIVVDDSNYFEGINYDEYYSTVAPDYNLTDKEMGIKYGVEDGKDSGYYDGLEGNPKDENTYQTESDYGPIYLEAYKNAYINAYLESYEVGKSHKENPAEKGSYDGSKYAYGNGFFDGSHGNECTTYDMYFLEEEGMPEEYIEAYKKAYEEKYLKGYEEGLKNPASDEEEWSREMKEFYHLASLIKNASRIMETHYPQTNLKLITSRDSYYNSYEIIDGEAADNKEEQKEENNADKDKEQDNTNKDSTNKDNSNKDNTNNTDKNNAKNQNQNTGKNNQNSNKQNNNQNSDNKSANTNNLKPSNQTILNNNIQKSSTSINSDSTTSPVPLPNTGDNVELYIVLGSIVVLINVGMFAVERKYK